MDINMHHVRKNLCSLLAIGGAAALAWLTAAPPAQAHVIRPSVCDRAWQQAPAGQKWERKARCLRILRKHRIDHACQPKRVVPRSVKVKGERADRGQRHVLGWILHEGRRRHLRRVAVLAAIVATTQEASARELRHGHGSSLGPFQLIDIHGSAAQRISVEFSGNWFYNGAVKVLRDQPSIGPAQLAQAVERSAYPSAYNQWLPEARRTLRAYQGLCNYYR